MQMNDTVLVANYILSVSHLEITAGFSNSHSGFLMM